MKRITEALTQITIWLVLSAISIATIVGLTALIFKLIKWAM